MCSLRSPSRNTNTMSVHRLGPRRSTGSRCAHRRGRPRPVPGPDRRGSRRRSSEVLRALRDVPGYSFWPETVSYADARLDHVQGHPGRRGLSSSTRGATPECSPGHVRPSAGSRVVPACNAGPLTAANGQRRFAISTVISAWAPATRPRQDARNPPPTATHPRHGNIEHVLRWITAGESHGPPSSPCSRGWWPASR